MIDAIKNAVNKIKDFFTGLSFKQIGLICVFFSILSLIGIFIFKIELLTVFFAISFFGLVYSIVVPIQEKRVNAFKELEENQ